MAIQQKRSSFEVYSAAEVAEAAGVPFNRVAAAIASGRIQPVIGPGAFFAPSQAVAAVQALRADVGHAEAMFEPPLFAHASPRLPVVVSSAFHAGLAAAIVLISTMGLSEPAQTERLLRDPVATRLVFLATPGPGGGGGGGGLRQRTPPPRAKREGKSQLDSPIPVREAPKPVEPVVEPAPPPPAPKVEPKPEPLPPVIAPVATVAANDKNQAGVIDVPAPAQSDSRGPGAGGGVGSGTGTGLGEGSGSGIGDGSGGGMGGGPYRPGSGITPPKIVSEVKADYTEDARRRSLEGEVVLEIVVRRDGSVGDVKLLTGLGGGLNDRAIAAVRQWRFQPARRLGQPVDVVVEVAVEFKLR